MLGDRSVATSIVLHLDAVQARARTISRWYRLGRPFIETSADVQRDETPQAPRLLHDLGRVDLRLVVDLKLAAQMISEQVETIRQLAKEFDAGGSHFPK